MADLPEVRFYHLETAEVASELPALAEKVVATGRSALLLAPDAESLEQLDKALWNYDPLSFLPHGRAGGPYDDNQPLLLADSPEYLPARDLLIVADGASPDEITTYTRVLYMFDGRRDDILSKARADWSSYKAAGHPLSYWQKNAGRWEQKV